MKLLSIFRSIILEQFSGSIKPGVEELFKSNQELASIGTPEEYSKYLDTIFPQSKIKDIVYHGTDVEFDNFDDKFIGKKDPGYYGKGFYFGKTLEGAKHIAFAYTNRPAKPTELISAILNLKNPLKIQSGDFSYTGKDLEGYDGAYAYSSGKYNDSGVDEIKDNIVVKSASQIHILGGKQDIDGFKKFVQYK